MALQNYEIGSIVDTPRGRGMVTATHWATHMASVQLDSCNYTFHIEELEGWAARDLSPEELEEWLESPDPQPPRLVVSELASEDCACACGQQGGCYNTMRDGKVIMHMRNGACRCQERDCDCRR